jgi:hypothetical protein
MQVTIGAGIQRVARKHRVEVVAQPLAQIGKVRRLRGRAFGDRPAALEFELLPRAAAILLDLAERCVDLRPRGVA